uniref:Uncharacterized protein n=1 Tax=Aegilops tauschii subsp. strangulata TaxID=200361 RepID=A0A453H8C4_AEGTS
AVVGGRGRALRRAPAGRAAPVGSVGVVVQLRRRGQGGRQHVLVAGVAVLNSPSRSRPLLSHFFFLFFRSLMVGEIAWQKRIWYLVCLEMMMLFCCRNL